MAYQVIITPQAENDLESIALHIAENSIPRAIAFVEKLRSKIHDLRENPARFQKFNRFRRFVYGNYIVAYTIDDDRGCVNIVLVCEGHRDWMNVLREWSEPEG
jgi:toxin ParE1/3/4